jgi:hypothetical protein
MAEQDYGGMVEQANKLASLPISPGAYGGMGGAATGFLNHPAILQALEQYRSPPTLGGSINQAMMLFPAGRMGPRPAFAAETGAGSASQTLRELAPADINSRLAEALPNKEAFTALMEQVQGLPVSTLREVARSFSGVPATSGRDAINKIMHRFESLHNAAEKALSYKGTAG